MNRFTFATPTRNKHLAAVLMLGLVSASNVSAQVDISSRNVISDSGNGQGNTIITSNHASAVAGKMGGQTAVTASNVIRNSGNGSGNKIVASNHASASPGSAGASPGATGQARVRISNTIEDSGNGEGNLVVGSHHVTLGGSQLGPGETIHYHNEIRKRGNGSGSVVISSDGITLERPGTTANPGQGPVQPSRLLPPHVATANQTSQVISTRIGRQFVVELESDPASHARWDLRYDRSKLLVVRREPFPAEPMDPAESTDPNDESPVEMAPPGERYTFVSLALGTSSIELQYGQPGQKPSTRLVLQVNVGLD